ncbi:2-C-methyl-D-erythritol 2,4-cyclodiphosphate synthase [bacterium]|nr:2-C-methyl-D-erythritol 2,4-cyclodiphosphate synthase [bacterium]
MRIGIGYDIHKLVMNRDLIIGGVKIPFIFGLEAHSDGDVLVHAICDGILGALNKGDIGQHFPDDDPLFEGISSLKFLEEIDPILRMENMEINNIDTIIFAEKPKMSPYIDNMKLNIAKALNTEKDTISIKAKTYEQLGPIGEGKAVAAQAIVSLHVKEL